VFPARYRGNTRDTATVRLERLRSCVPQEEDTGSAINRPTTAHRCQAGRRRQ
jgi:hypothetical protein